MTKIVLRESLKILPLCKLTPVKSVVRFADMQLATIQLEVLLVNVILASSILRETETAWTWTSVYPESQFVPVRPNVKTLSVPMIVHALPDTSSKLTK